MVCSLDPLREAKDVDGAIEGAVPVSGSCKVERLESQEFDERFCFDRNLGYEVKFVGGQFGESKVGRLEGESQACEGFAIRIEQRRHVARRNVAT